jgi:hypothetical protein
MVDGVVALHTANTWRAGLTTEQRGYGSGWQWTMKLWLEGHERTVYGVSWGKGSDVERVGWVANIGRAVDVSQSVSDSSRVQARSLQSAPATDVYDANAFSFCARPGFERVLATAGDDGCVVTSGRWL